MTAGGRLGDLQDVVDRMPNPAGTGDVERLESALAEHFGVRYAVAVNSGTAALHCALLACDIGPGDEVLVPAISVVMSVAPILYTGATPVFVDSNHAGTDFDHDDLAAKLTPRTGAVLPVYLWGRAGHASAVAAFARTHGLRMIEDACQAQGTHLDGRPLGTFGDIGCFSTKDGKLLWSGEGGFIITDDSVLADRCRAYRTHWQTPPAGEPPLSRIGHNYRLADPLARLARINLARVDELLARRRAQTALLTDQLHGHDRLIVMRQEPASAWNGYAPLFGLKLGRPRAFCRRLADLGVPNSVGTYGLISNADRALYGSAPTPCPTAATVIDRTLAVVVTERDDDDQIAHYAAVIAEEATRWPHP